ncbi:MAG: hypothetical protein AAF846_11145 [Chloroflexota bacterium]
MDFEGSQQVIVLIFWSLQASGLLDILYALLTGVVLIALFSRFVNRS